MDKKNKEIGDSSNPVDSGNPPSAEVSTARTDVSLPQVTNSETGTSSNNNGSGIEECGVEANREKKHLEKEDNGNSRNVEDKKSPKDALKEIQVRKTHDLYCPNCIHNITETAKFFEKGEETFPYNKEKFISWFVIVISFKYPFIYLPWLYNNTPVPSGQSSDGLEPTQRVVDETPKKHALDWLLLLLVVVLLLLSAIVLAILVFLTPSLLLSPPPPLRYTNESLTSLIHDPQKIPKDIEDIRDHLKPHAPNIIKDDSPISPSSPPPPPSSYANESLPILVPDLQKTQEDVIEIYDHLKSHVPDVVEDDGTIPPSPPLPLPQQPSLPHTDGSLQIPDPQKIQDVTEIDGRLNQHVHDVIENDILISLSPPSLPPSPLSSLPHTKGSSTTSITDPKKISEDVVEICGRLVPHVPDVIKDDKPISHSPPLPLPQTVPHANENLTILISDPQKIPEDAANIHGRLKPHVPVVVEDDRNVPLIPPSIPPSLPPLQSHNNGSSKVLNPNMQKIPDDVTKIRGHLKPHVPDVVEDDKTIPLYLPSTPPSLPQTPPHTNGSSTTLIPEMQKIPEDVTKIHSHLKPHVLDIVEDDTPIPHSPLSTPPSLPPLPPHTNGSSTTLIPEMQKNPADVTKIHNHLKPHVLDVVEDDTPIPHSPLSTPPSLPPLPPHTNGSSTTLIPEMQKIPEDVTKIHSHMKPHVFDVVEDDTPIPHSPLSTPSSLPPLPPHTNGSSTTLIPEMQKIPADVTKIHNHLKPHVLDVVENDTPIPHLPLSTTPSLPPLPSHTNGSTTTLIPDVQKIPEDVTKIQGGLKPPSPSSSPSPLSPVPLPPPLLHTNTSFTIDEKNTSDYVTEIPNSLGDVIKDDGTIPPSLPPLLPSTNETLMSLIPDLQKIPENFTEIKSHVFDDRPIMPSPPLPLSQSPSHTNGSLPILDPGLQRIPEHVTKIHGRMESHVPDVVEDDKHISSTLSSSPSLPPALPTSHPPHTNENLTNLMDDLPKVQDDVTKIYERPKPQVPGVVEVDRLIHINGSSKSLTHQPQKIPEDILEIHDRMKSPGAVEEDKLISPSLPPPPPWTHTNEPSTMLIPNLQEIPEDVTKIHSSLKPHDPDLVDYDIPAMPSTPHSNSSLTSLVHDQQKIPEDIIETHGHLKPHTPDVLEDDRAIPLLPPPPLPLPPPLPPSPHTSGSLTNVIPDLQKNSEDVTEIHSRLEPHSPDVLEDDRHVPPSPLPIKNEGGWITLSWFKNFSSNMDFSVISLFLLSILALCCLSIYWKQRTQSKNDVANVDMSNGEAQDSTNSTEDVTGVETNEDVASQTDHLSTTDHKTNGSGTETIPSPPVISPPMPSAKLPEIFWQHIIVPVQNFVHTELDILKSIVYGGLIESITSFGVVSSAAASGTSTLNVMALGIANLFCGLFLIIYNLCGLVMSEPYYQSANIDHMTDVKATDPYEELLGNRKKVILHCVVVVVSFTFFGVIPPLFYGLSFKITDNGHYEQAAVVVAASLVCVISLSFAKAYAFGMDKLKTVAAYTGIAIVGSALSFIASQRARDMFDKYDLHKLASGYLKG